MNTGSQSSRVKSISGWDGLMQASSDQQDAARDLKEAAAQLKAAVSGGSLADRFSNWVSNPGTPMPTFSTPAAQPARAGG